MIVALSNNAVQSSYVTFEWAYALGREKVVIPLKLEECKVHPRLEPIQYLDFSNQGSLPWETLAERILEVETEATSDSDIQHSPDPNSLIDPKVKAILAYLNQRGYQMMTYDRVRLRIDDKMTDEDLDKFIKSHRHVFSKATLRKGKKGIKKLIP